MENKKLTPKSGINGKKVKSVEKVPSNMPIPEETAKEIVRNNNPLGKGGFGSVDTEKGDNARYLRHALSSVNLPPIDISNEKQVADRIEWYFEHCADEDMKPTVMGMANALGIDRRTLYDWGRGKFRDATHSPVVKRAYAVLEELYEDYMLNGKINPVSGIFLGKNHFNYTDKQDIVVTPNNPLEQKRTAAELAEEYGDELPPPEEK